MTVRHRPPERELGDTHIEGPKPTHVKKEEGRGAVGSYISLAASHLKLTLDFCIGVRIRMPRKDFEQSLIPP